MVVVPKPHDDADELWQVAQQLRSCCNLEDEKKKSKTIVITGANSGIGLVAAKLLLLLLSSSTTQSPSTTHRLVLVCRTQQKAEEAAAQVRNTLPSHPHASNFVIYPLACDQSSLNQVHRFNERIRQVLAGISIDILCLNAAVLTGRDDPIQYTNDGFEQTFQINYLSTFLLSNLLVDLLTPQTGRMILSSSGLFLTTPLDTSGMTLQAKFPMPDGSSYHYKRAYSLSKVYLVALCAELQQRHNHIHVNCFSPGLMMESGLFRHQSPTGVAQLREHNPHAIANAKSVAWGAGAFTYMMLMDITTTPQYWSDRTSQLGNAASYREHFTPISIPEVLDRHETERLWEKSQALIDGVCGLHKDETKTDEYHQVVG